MKRKKIIKTAICLTVVWSMRLVFALSFHVYAISEASWFREQGCVQHTFDVTAYYSPEKSQSFYIKHGYVAETALNGKGIAGASGKPVFNGMLAAPADFSFGTKIYLPGRGRGEVADRGGAIVNQGEKNEQHDRLDMRVGNGEEGLVRAISFGKPTINGRICPSNITMTYTNGQKAFLGFDRSKINISKYFFLASLYYKHLREGMKGPRVRTLQEQMIRLGYLGQGLQTGYFGKKTKDSVCNFQVVYGVLSSKKSEWCGIYGPQTAMKLRNVLKKKGLFPQDLWSNTVRVADIVNEGMGIKTYGVQHELQKNVLSHSESHLEGQPESSGVTQRIYTKSALTIKDIEQALVLLGYAPGTIDGQYDNDLKQAVIAFKQAHGRAHPTGTLDTRFKRMLRLVDIGWLANVSGGS